MERYGHNFDRERWGGRGQESGWPDEHDWEGGSFQGRQGAQRGAEFGGRPAGGYGGYGGGQRFGQGRGGGQFRAAGYGGGGYGGGYAGYDQERGYGGGMGGGYSQEGRAERVRAAEIMTENPETVTPDTTLADAARKMRDLDVGIIPVVESQESRRLQGVITDRDIAVRAVAEGRDVSSTTVSDVMTTELEVCNKNDPVSELLGVMQREQVRRVPITDREGRLVGIVAQADIAVDFLGDQPQAKREVARTLRRVSEPGEPQRGGRAGRGGSGRTGGSTRGSQQRGRE